MHPQLILMVAQQQIADLRRAADHDRLVQAATTASSSDAAGRRRRRAGHARRRLRRRLAQTHPAARYGRPSRLGDRRMPAAVAKQGQNRMSVAPACRQNRGQRPRR
jgi:hypothetical protein